MIYISVFSAILYTLLLLYFRRYLYAPLPEGQNTPSVSILIAMRNEEHRLPALLESLKHLTYPKHSLEIWLLDDGSTDRTQELAKSFAEEYDHVHYKRITHRHAGLKSKMNALAQGINASKGDIIFITDADCQVPPRWITKTVAFFADPRVVMVGGANFIQGNTLVATTQRVDLLYLLGIAAAFTNMGFPITILGNNMAFRRRAYEAVGGFERIGFSVTEDAALLQALRHLPDARIVYSLHPETMVSSIPCPTWQDTIKQRQRWATGGKQTTPWWTWLLLFPGILPRIFIWLGIFFLPLPWYVIMGAIILTGDFLFLSSLFRQLHKPLNILPWLMFELLISLYLPFLSFTTPLIKSTRWKDRMLSL